MELAGIAKLGPDACRTDTCASCFYAHTKDRYQCGETLSRFELDLIGAYQPRTSNGGWHAVDVGEIDLYPSLSPEDRETLHALMAIDVPSRERLEFLGG